MLRPLRKCLPPWAPTVAVALAVYWVLRDQVLEAYPVPTPSMEPTIEGDQLHGDVVLVDKTFDNRARPKRFDTIVFRHDADRRIIVKRVVGLPGEWILIRNYDLWVGPSKTDLRLVRKDPVAHADLLATRWDSAVSPGGFLGRAWRRDRARGLGGGGIELDGTGTTFRDLFDAARRHTRWRAAWNLTYRGNVTTGYLDGFGDLQEGRMAYDFGVRLGLRGEKRTTLWVDLRYGASSYALRYAGGGEATIWHDGEPSPDPAATCEVPPLRPDRPVELVFLYLDGALRLAAAGRSLLELAVPFDDLKTAAWNGGQGATNGVAVAAAGGKVIVDHLALVHDFHYLAIGPNASFEPYPIPPGDYFVLGDNSRDSRDSRHYGSIPGKSIIGRPFAVAAPWTRMRLFRR